MASKVQPMLTNNTLVTSPIAAKNLRIKMALSTDQMKDSLSPIGSNPLVQNLCSVAALRDNALLPVIQRQMLINTLGQTLGNCHLQRDVIPQYRPVVQLQPRHSLPNDYVAEQQRFSQQQALFFASIGNEMRAYILQAAGFAHGQQPTTPTDALRVVSLWGITIENLSERLPEIGRSKAGIVHGRQASTNLADQQDQLIRKLTDKGKQTFQQVLSRIREEPFWQDHLARHPIYIFPDLTGTNRYAGYTQRSNKIDESGIPTQAFIVHISKDQLDNGEVREATALLVHELSHTAYEPGIIRNSLQTFTSNLSNLLANHPDLVALRRKATNPDDARQTHVKQISQIIYERTGYAEDEILVHLQQLTHQPEVQNDRVRTPAHIYIFDTVKMYVEQLRKIRLPPHLLTGIVASITRRVAILYDRRIAAASRDPRVQEKLALDKRAALVTLRLAVNE